MASDTEATPTRPSAGVAGRDAKWDIGTLREQRLAEALRENLRRRKRQQRERAVRTDGDR